MANRPATPELPEQPHAGGLGEHHWIEPLNDGTHILIRPLEAKDREREFAFIKSLSPQSRHFRFLATINEPGKPMLDQLMDLDYRKRMAYVALIMDQGQLLEIGVARYAALAETSQCESAVVVADAWQHKGLATLLMKHLINKARLNGFTEMMSVDSAANSAMHRLANKLGFVCRQDPLDASQVIYRMNLY
ncbi:MAG TPA: GNAT family N-acetyltransferase [Pseudomonas sp.]|jgi:GNAT superfamily N-acetyltransferase|uniref:GNAT family N-acetyltransferase n=1 Tax=Pseudomonas sp. TaxID=306 RepID=UPI002ED7935F